MARVRMTRGEVVLQQPVDEDITAANLAQEDTLGGIVQERDIMPGCDPMTPEHQTEQQVLETRPPSVSDPNG